MNVGWYDHFIFVIFVWILWDCRNFAVRMKTGCVGRFLMQTLFYRLTSKRKHLTLPKNAIKENGFIFASLTSPFFSFFYVSVVQIASFTNRKSQSPLTKIGDKNPLFSDFYPSFFSLRFKFPQSTCDTLIRNINFHFLYTPRKSLFDRGSLLRIKYLRHSNT